MGQSTINGRNNKAGPWQLSTLVHHCGQALAYVLAPDVNAALTQLKRFVGSVWHPTVLLR